MSKIDDLYKRAFGHSNHAYSDDSWGKMDALLNEKMPVGSTASTFFLKTISGIAASAVIAGAAYFGSTTTETVKTIDNTNQVAQIIDSEPQITEIKNNADQSAEPSIRGKSIDNFKLEEQSTSKAKFVKNKLENRLNPVSSSKPNENKDVSAQGSNKPVADVGLTENQTFEINSEKDEKRSFFGLVENSIISSKSALKRGSDMVKIKKMGINSKTPSLALLDVNLAPQIKIERNWKSVKTVSVYGGYESITDDKKLRVSGVDETGKSDLNNTINQTFTAGVNVQVALKKWYGSIGVGITQRSSAYKFEETTTNSWDEQKVLTDVEFAGFDSVILGQEIRIVERDGVEYMEIVSTKYGIDTAYRTVYDTINLTHSTTENNQRSFGYKANYLSIPMVIGYEQQINKFSVGLGVGLQMNVLSSISGQVYDGSDHQFKAEFENRLNPIVYATSLQANIGYDIQPGLSLILQPRVVKSLNSTFKQGDELASNYTGFGTTVSLRYKF
ncbi:MAG: hypothetical protein ACPGEG_00105 [Salibacteraceae bacterium]